MGVLPHVASGLDNGFSKPAMGWNPWNCFGVGRTGSPKFDDPRGGPKGFNESLIHEVVDAIVSTGLAKAGYVNVGVDCGWTTGFRDNITGAQIVNTTRFPSGMKALGDYIHSKGLKYAIYSSASTSQCCSKFYTGANDGSLDHEVADAKRYVEFGVDYLKFDGCGQEQRSYPAMRDALNATGHPVVLAVNGLPVDKHSGKFANSWRTTPDDDYEFNTSLVPRAFLNNEYAALARPGQHNDADMLEVGNFAGDAAMAYTESRTHFGAWCIVSSPLILGLDLTDSANVDIVWDIITNKEAIAVNQLWAGQPGQLVDSSSSHQVWAKPLPKGEIAVLVFNLGQNPIDVSLATSAISPSLRDSSIARSIWNHTDMHGMVSGGRLRISALAGHDSVFYRFSAGSDAAMSWRPIAPELTAMANTRPRSSMSSSSLAACERIRGPEECMSLTSCEQRCAAAGHCCVGATSGWQHPSCAQGCIVAQHTASLAACEAACDAADGKCNWKIDSIQMTNCQSCPSTCCNAVVADECRQGCGFAFAMNLNQHNLTYQV